MKSRLLPKTTLGKWSIGMVIAAVLLFVIFMIEIAAGMRGGDSLDFTNLSDLLPAIPILLAGVSFVAAMVVGIVSILKSKERSALVILSTVISFLVFLFILGEFLSPH
jgi:hypothetical protein